MNKKIILLFSWFLIVISLNAQDVKNDESEGKTKIDAFSSKTGVITKYTDYNLGIIKTSFTEIAETRIRKLTSGTSVLYFYQIEKTGKYGNSTGSIEYTDLLEMAKALKTLEGEVDKDVASDPDYMENKFVTVDGFQVGYSISKGKANWFLKLEKFSSDKTLFINSVDIIISAFDKAIAKIEELSR